MMLSELIRETSELLQNHLAQIDKLVQEMSAIVPGYRKNVVEKPFNLILASSDFYYQENFHSEIMAAILEIADYRRNFFDLLNRLVGDVIRPQDYSEASVKVEDAKIDILIEDQKSKHCIIIESKLNNAGDQPRQIPRYVDRQQSRGFRIDTVIYLSLDGSKRPDQSTWTIRDTELCGPVQFIYLAAFNNTTSDLVNGFLVPSMTTNCSIQEFSFFQQYKDLLEYIGRNQMDMLLMEKFYQQISDIEKYQTAQSLRLMLSELPTYRRERLYNHFLNNYFPFDGIHRWSTNDTLFVGIKRLTNENVKLDMFSEEKWTRVQLWIQDPRLENDLIGDLLNGTELKSRFEKKKNNFYEAIFTFPSQESELYKFVRDLLSQLEISVADLLTSSST
jgi:PD-(D/E)XK nuclease superfamily protein